VSGKLVIPRGHLPGWWKFQGEHPREKKAFSAVRIDGVRLEPGFAPPVDSRATGNFPACLPTASLGFFIVVPQEAGVTGAVAPNVRFTVTADRCTCPEVGDEDPDCARHGTAANDARVALHEAIKADEANRPLPPTAAVVSWTDQERRVHVPVLSAVDAARMADALTPLPAWVNVPADWPWTLEGRR